MVLVITSCDPAFKLLVDGYTNKQLTCDCGNVMLIGTSSMRDWVHVKLEGDFKIQPYSLDIEYSLNVAKDIQLWYNDTLIDNSLDISVRGKNQLGLRMLSHLKFPMHWARNDTIQLLPSDFILCNGKPVITDTIRFYCKPRKRKRNGSPARLDLQSSRSEYKHF